MSAHIEHDLQFQHWDGFMQPLLTENISSIISVSWNYVPGHAFDS